MSELQVVNGTLNELEERVIFYARVKSSGSSPGGVVAFYGTQKAKDYMNLIERVFGSFSNQFKNAKERFPSIDGKYKYHGVPIPNISEHDLEWNPEVVIFVGEFDSEDRCKLEIVNSVGLYFKFLEKERVIGGSKPGERRQKPDYYKDIPIQDMYEHISGRYISAIIAAVHSGDKRCLTRLRRDFARFSYGSVFYDDAYRLFMFLQDPAKHKNEHGIRTAISRMVMKYAVQEEAYEVAAQMRDKAKVDPKEKDFLKTIVL